MSKEEEILGKLDVELARAASKEIPHELAGSPQDIRTTTPTEGQTAGHGGSGISYRRLVIVMSALCLTIFLNALDQTIVSTSVATIAADFGDASGYTWIGTSFLLASTVPLPLYGKASDIWGRKLILFIAIGLFEIGSALCGASQNMNMLIASRVVQGAGAGGILGTVQITISDLVSLRDRAKWTGLIGATWAIAAACGPLIGGAIATGTTWRWCFLINLPVGGICAAILFFYLHLDSPTLSFWDKAPRVDWTGTTSIGGSALMLLLALNWAGAGYGWGSARVIGLLVGSVAALVPFYFAERRAKEPVMPLRLFTNRTNIASYFVAFCHRVIYMILTYYLPLYFQAVKGYSALMAGVALLPYIFICCLLATAIGRIVSATGRYNEVIRIGFAITVLGSGLCILLNENTPVYAWVLIEIVCGLGVGGNFQNMLLAIQATIHYTDMATATATFTFVILLGATFGVAVGGTVFQNQMTRLSSGLSDIPGLSEITGSNAGAAIQSIRELPPNVKAEIVSNYAESMKMVWIVCCAFSAVAFLATFAIGTHELHRDIRTDQPAMMKRKRRSKADGSAVKNCGPADTESAGSSSAEKV